MQPIRRPLTALLFAQTLSNPVTGRIVDFVGEILRHSFLLNYSPRYYVRYSLFGILSMFGGICIQNNQIVLIRIAHHFTSVMPIARTSSAEAAEREYVPRELFQLDL